MGKCKCKVAGLVEMHAGSIVPIPLDGTSLHRYLVMVPDPGPFRMPATGRLRVISHLSGSDHLIGSG